MVDGIQYPKRYITVESFADQIDFINKTLVEVENQPPKQYIHTKGHNQGIQQGITHQYHPSLNGVVDKSFPQASANVCLGSFKPVSNVDPDVYLQHQRPIQQVPQSAQQVPQQSQQPPRGLNAYSMFDPFSSADLTPNKLSSMAGHQPSLFTSSGPSILGNNKTPSSSIWGNNSHDCVVYSDTTVWG